MTLDRFAPTPSEWVPPSHSDARVAWAGAYPNRPDLNIRVEAAAVADKPVYFDIVAPWTRPQRVELPNAATQVQRQASAQLPPLILIPGGAVFLARRNLRLGRGDRRGHFA